jgi:hypothetical protein
LFKQYKYLFAPTRLFLISNNIQWAAKVWNKFLKN